MSRLYGAFIQIKERRCVVVGGGPVAERKITGLLDCQGVVTVIAPSVTEVIAGWAGRGTIEWLQREYRPGDAAGAFLTIAATDSKDVNARVAAEAEQSGRLVNVVNDPERGNVTLPAVVRRGRLQIAVSTSGASPLIAKRIRQELERHFGEEYEEYLDLLAEARRQLLLREQEEEQRTAIFRKLADSDLLALLRQGQRAEAERLIADITGGRVK